MNKGMSLLWSTILAVTMVSFFFSMTPVAQAADLSVETSAVCEDVVDREPVNEGTSFSVSVGKLYYFTKIVGALPISTPAGPWRGLAYAKPITRSSASVAKR